MVDEAETDENESRTVWKGKGPIVYSFSVEAPERNPESDVPPWRSETPGDTWKYRLSVTGASGQYETRVPEIFFIAETKPGIIRDMAAYMDLSLNLRDKQFFSLPQISPDNVEIIDNTKEKGFSDLDVRSIFANAKRIADAKPPVGEPTYVIEITKNNNEPQDKQYNVNIIYANGFVDLTGLVDSRQGLQEGVDKFSKISALLVPIAVSRYVAGAGQRNDIKPNPNNMKVVNFTDNPDFTAQQISTAVKAIIPVPRKPMTQTPSIAMQEAIQGARSQPGRIIQAPRYVEQALPPKRTEEAPASMPVAAKEQEPPAEERKEPPSGEPGKGQVVTKPEKEKEEKKNKEWFRFHTPKYGFDSVIGMGYAKKFFKDNVILGLERPDLFAKYKKSIHDGFLLYGPPGIGKTFVCGALAKEAKMKLLVVSIHQLLDMYLGNTEKNIHAVFEQARENAPCMILFDEIDGLGVSRRVSRESGNASSALALNQLLMEMDGLESDNKNVIVMGTTNAPQDVDTALLRSGRFTNILYMRPPDKEDRTKLFEFYVDDIPKGKLDYGKLGEESNNLSPADIKAVVKTAVTPLIAEAAEGGRTKDLTTDSLLSAVRSRRATGSTMIKWYEDVDKVLQKGGFSEEDKLLYSDMLKDVKKRVKRAPRKNRRRARKAKSSMEITNGERLRS